MRLAFAPLRFLVLGLAGLTLFLLACVLLVTATYLLFLAGVIPRSLTWPRRQEEDRANAYEQLRQAPLLN